MARTAATIQCGVTAPWHAPREVPPEAETRKGLRNGGRSTCRRRGSVAAPGCDPPRRACPRSEDLAIVDPQLPTGRRLPSGRQHPAAGLRSLPTASSAPRVAGLSRAALSPWRHRATHAASGPRAAGPRCIARSRTYVRSLRRVPCAHQEENGHCLGASQTRRPVSTSRLRLRLPATSAVLNTSPTRHRPAHRASERMLRRARRRSPIRMS